MILGRSHWFLVGSCVVAFLGCKSRSFLGGATVSNQEAAPYVELLKKNDSASRARMAASLELEFRELIAKSDAPPTEATMRELVLSTIRALRTSGATLCSEEEKLDLFHASNDRALRTADGKDFRLSPYLYGDMTATSLAQGVAFYASAEVWITQDRERRPVGKAISPSDFDEIAARHTTEYAKSPLVSTSASGIAASTFGSTVFRLRMCPGRVFSTSMQGYDSEYEFLTLGFILPEEIVGVGTPDEAARVAPSPVLQCFAPSPETFDKGAAKMATQETMIAWNRLATEHLSKSRMGQGGASWRSAENGFIQRECGCFNLMKRANEQALGNEAAMRVYIENGYPLPLWNIAEECGLSRNEVSPVVYVTQAETMMKAEARQASELAANAKCLVKRGDAIVARSVKETQGHLEVVPAEALPRGCALPGPVFLYAPHARLIH